MLIFNFGGPNITLSNSSGDDVGISGYICVLPQESLCRSYLYSQKRGAEEQKIEKRQTRRGGGMGTLALTSSYYRYVRRSALVRRPHRGNHHDQRCREYIRRFLQLLNYLLICSQRRRKKKSVKNEECETSS